MKLIVGLGNPGKEYNLTRHNVGFMVLETLARQNDIRFKRNKRFKALAGEGIVGRENCYLAMPQTFMNLSGHSVRSIVNWLKVDINEMLLIIDDIALPFGSIRIRPKGSDAGHKGMRSVIDCLGTGEFSRMRIGIRNREDIKDLVGYVLDKFTRKEQKVLPHVLERASLACEQWIKEGITATMNNFNKRLETGKQ